MSTTGYNAGLDSSDVVMSYAKETVWGQKPAVAFQQVRMTGEGFREQKQRSRPEEIEPRGFVAHAITQSVSAEGSLSVALSAGTYDDLLAGLVNGEWSAPINISGTDIEVKVAAGVASLESATANKFAGIKSGQFVRVEGFVNPLNNGVFRVATATALKLTLAGTTGMVAAATGASVKISGRNLRNGVDVQTFMFQKQFAPALFFVYPGAYVSEGQISAEQGDFVTGSFNFLVKEEQKGTVNASTGAVLPAPEGRVIDTVEGVKNVKVNDTVIDAVTQGMSLSITKQNARQQFGIGSAAAQGMARGSLELTGTFSTYFKSFAQYDLYKSETDQMVTFIALDNTGAGYAFTLPAVTLMNPQIVAGGPDTDVVAEFELEGNAGTGVFNGVVIQIDKIPAPTA